MSPHQSGQQAEIAIRAAGLRASVSRVVVLEFLTKHGGWADINEIYADIAEQQKYNFGYNTIYRALADLSDAGLVEREFTSSTKRKAFYARKGMRAMEASAAVLTCTNCGNELRIPSEALVGLLRSITGLALPVRVGQPLQISTHCWHGDTSMSPCKKDVQPLHNDG